MLPRLVTVCCKRSSAVAVPLLLVVLLLVPAGAAKLPPPPTQALVVPTGRAPCGLDAHGGELWVGVYEAGTILRLDRAGRVQRRHRVGPWSCRVAVDGRAAWVTRDRANELVRIDLRTGRLRRLSVSSPFDVTVAAGAVWTTSFEAGRVTRIHPVSLRRTSYRIGGNPAGIAACGGHIWVGNGRDATWLTALDPRTGRARRVDVVVEGPGWPRCIGGELWVTTEDAVLRVAPRTGELLGRVPLAGTPAEAAAAPAFHGSSLIWVTDKERSLVHRLDRTGLVYDSFPAGAGAFSLVSFDGSMWVTSFAGSDVRRYDP